MRESAFNARLERSFQAIFTNDNLLTFTRRHVNNNVWRSDLVHQLNKKRDNCRRLDITGESSKPTPRSTFEPLPTRQMRVSASPPPPTRDAGETVSKRRPYGRPSTEHNTSLESRGLNAQSHCARILNRNPKPVRNHDLQRRKRHPGNADLRDRDFGNRYRGDRRCHI